MKIETCLNEATKSLQPESGTARLDAEVLLADVLQKNRAWILAHPEFELNEKITKKLNSYISRRAKHEPLAYIRGKVEFYGREFAVDKHVLVPRPESETMIEQFKKLKLPKNVIIADVGSGSGAIGATAALEKPDILIHFIDIDPETLVVARTNAKKYGIKAEFHESNLLEAHTDKYDALLCNLPYIPANYNINRAAMTEPKIAIFGGKDGLDLYRQLFSQLKTGKYGSPVVLTESLPFQHSNLRNIALEEGYTESKEDDFIQVFVRSN